MKIVLIEFECIFLCLLYLVGIVDKIDEIYLIQVSNQHDKEHIIGDRTVTLCRCYISFSCLFMEI